MRSSLIPKRPLRRICEICKLQQQQHAPKNFSHATGIPSTTLRKPPHRQLTDSRTPTHSSQRTSSSIPQTRSISSTAKQNNPESSSTPKKETKPPTKTHYDLFPQTLPSGPPPAGPFAIDTRALRREFLTLQATAHPDLAPAGTAQKRRAEAASAHINDAYRTLSHPLSRAQYLLSLRGIDAANEETARVEDAELLMLVLETREMIEEAGEEAELEPLRLANEGRIRVSEGVLAGAFEGGDLGRAREEVTRLRYWVNIAESIHNWERGKPVVLEH